ncbi:MAG: adenylosuccinate synthase [Cyclobacteriaceae bacterium]|nr:adenylosuccinate synthase [Cyclobacteriaceae bacterium]MCH8516828.1 adenylosuccinate synthase [Cyclobacteriaceae bacterium]
MKVDVLLGLQWGDEGKGKIVDFLAPHYDIVARFQGGPNAGHTLEFDGIKHVLHQIPSGIFRENIQNVIGNGVVLDPVILKKELEALKQFNIDPRKNLFISEKAQLILPTHALLDAAYEKAKGSSKIGSTLKGIGPTYQDKIARLGLRAGDIKSADFKKKYEALRDQHKTILEFYDFDYSDVLAEKENLFFEALEYLQAFKITSTEYLINQALNEGKRVLAEGAQGSLLDIDFGSYPFVTSSNTMAAGACTGLGVAPKNIGEVFGVFKAYCTRVGSGPFPTELFDEDGKQMAKIGNEFGATTGRPRRCGWLDLPALQYACMINGVTQLYMMKADVLNSFETIKFATAYQDEAGQQTTQMPYDVAIQKYDPIYVENKGWAQEVKSDSFEQFPQALQNYIAKVEEYLHIPINLVSLGPDRTQTVRRESRQISS